MLDQTEKQRLYGELDAVLKEIRGSKFILADIKLNELLKAVALEPELYRLTEYCLKDFSSSRVHAFGGSQSQRGDQISVSASGRGRKSGGAGLLSAL